MRALTPLRTFALSVLAGAIAGFLGGAAARIAMRIAAWTAGPQKQGLVTAESAVVGAFTWDGTIAILGIGVLVGVAGGALYALARPLLPKRRSGLAFGAALLALFGWTIFLPAASDVRRFGVAPVNVLLFAGVFLLFGALVARIERRLDEAAPRGAWSYALWVPLATGGALLAFLNIVFGSDTNPTLGLLAICGLPIAHGVRLVARSRRSRGGREGPAKRSRG